MVFRLGRLQRRRVRDEVEAPGQPNQAGQPLRATRSRKKPEVHLREANLVTALGREPQVAGKRKLKPTTKAVARDCRDEYERRVLHLSKRLVRHEGGHESRPRAARREDAHVGAGREKLL